MYTVTFFSPPQWKHGDFKYKRKKWKCKYTSLHIISSDIFFCNWQYDVKKVIHWFLKLLYTWAESFYRCNTSILMHMITWAETFLVHRGVSKTPLPSKAHCVVINERTFSCVLHILTLLYSWEKKKLTMLSVVVNVV